MLSEENRNNYIGSTDIAVIAGLDNWKGPMDIYLEKLGLVEAQDENEAMWLGKEMEVIMDKRYEKETGMCPEKHPTIIDDWRRGSPDRIVNKDGKRILIEYKTTSYRKDWGAPWTDEMPERVSCQVFWLMGLMPDVMEAHVPVYFLDTPRQFAIYHLERNQEIIDQLTEIGRDFWTEHVLKRVPPPIDGSPGARRYLDLTYPQDKGEMLTATAHAQSVAFQLQSARERLKMAEQDKALAENFMKEIIQDAAGIQGNGWKVTWKKSKDRMEVDWKAAYYQLYGASHIGQAECDAIIDNATTIKPGPRVFRFWVKEDN